MILYINDKDNRIVKLSNMAKKVNLFLSQRSSSSLVSYLKNHGIVIGEDVTFYGNLKQVSIDRTRPSLVKIGDHVKIVAPFALITHGFEWTVFREKYRTIIGSAGRIVIGNNVYFGRDCCVLKGTSIGNNVIVGAKSLINKDIPSDCVAAGIPAKKIMGLEEYFEKRKAAQISEALEYARSIYQVEERTPRPEDFFEFFPLFLNRDSKEIADFNEKVSHLMTKRGRNPRTIQYQLGIAYDSFLNSEPYYSSFSEFLKDAGIPSPEKEN